MEFEGCSRPTRAISIDFLALLTVPEVTVVRTLLEAATRVVVAFRHFSVMGAAFVARFAGAAVWGAAVVGEAFLSAGADLSSAFALTIAGVALFKLGALSGFAGSDAGVGDVVADRLFGIAS